jgi:hypothetical protein
VVPLAHESSASQVARNCAEYVDRVAYRRESFTLLRGKRPIAESRPLPSGAQLAELPALLATLPRLSAAELDAFSTDLAAAREELDEPRDAWGS